MATGREASMNALKVQSQIRDNATQMQDALRDLGSWEKAIKSKDRELRGLTSGGTSVPVRGGGGRVTVKASAASGASTRSKPAKTAATSKLAADHTYDKGYKKWEKFDVDAALAASDDSDSEPEVDTVADTLPQEPTPPPPKQVNRVTPATIVGKVPQPRPGLQVPAAIGSQPQGDLEAQERERGNAFFKQGQFQDAVKSYTRCLGLNSRSVAAFSNRAMAHLKLKEFKKAELDCTLALQLDPYHTKSLLRRATARNALGKHRAALSDLYTAAESGQSTREVQAEIKRTKETLRSCMKRCPKVKLEPKLVEMPVYCAPAPTAGATAPATAPPNKVAEIASSAGIPVAPQEQQQQRVSPPPCATGNDVGEKELPHSGMKAPHPAPEGSTRKEESKEPTLQNNLHKWEESSSQDSIVAPPSSVSSKVLQAQQLAPSIAKGRRPLPKTSYEMEREWRNTRGLDSERLTWLLRFKISTWSKAFSSATDPGVFSNIIHLIKARATPAQSCQILLGLSQVQSLKMILLVLPSEDLATIKELLSSMEGSPDLCRGEEVDAIRDAFGPSLR